MESIKVYFIQAVAIFVVRIANRLKVNWDTFTDALSILVSKHLYDFGRRWI